MTNLELNLLESFCRFGWLVSSKHYNLSIVLCHLTQNTCRTNSLISCMHKHHHLQSNRHTTLYTEIIHQEKVHSPLTHWDETWKINYWVIKSQCLVYVSNKTWSESQPDGHCALVEWLSRSIQCWSHAAVAFYWLSWCLQIQPPVNRIYHKQISQYNKVMYMKKMGFIFLHISVCSAP